MFSDNVSESWDSTALQDAFIKDYFSKQAPLKKKRSKNKNTRVNQLKNIANTSLSIKEIISDGSSSKEEKNLKRERKLKKKALKNSLVISSNKIKNGDKNMKIKMKLKNMTKDLNVNSLENNIKEDVHNLSNTNFYLNMNSSKLIKGKAYQKLQAAKFRYLNEMLYTKSGKDSSKYFQENQDEFVDYHLGYQAQVSKWPLNPVDVIIKELKKGKNVSVIADLGCGEAKIAETLTDRTVHSFDLIALKDCVTACDIANVPLPDESVDATVFCLALMGTNWKEYLLEANRILKLEGLLKIAEIESRISNIDEFIRNIQSFGFSAVSKDLSHKMFVFLNFKKVKKNVKASKVKAMSLRPCLYKKR